MHSAGDAIEAQLRVVRVRIDALGESLDGALATVPEELRGRVRVRYEEEVAQVIEPVRVLSSSGGPRPWASGYDPSAGYYWRRQREHLLSLPGWSERHLESLDDASDTILAHVEDPRPAGPAEFRVRGLVMGFVQSGKTANFCAVIAKAADLGYKFIIVLSGIHNSLRQQTQRRVNRALGIDPARGVGQPEHGRRWVTLTSDAINGDFRAGTANANVLQGNEQVVLVVKKNKSVLERLLGWIGGAAPASLPVLVIDDEADQASVNTGGNRPPLEEMTDLTADDLGSGPPEQELDPSVINGLVRQLLGRFRRVSYVAYTATPFANILIDDQAVDRIAGSDLYPADFILSLPRPSGYVGAERLFGRGVLPGEDDAIPGLDVFRRVSDDEAGQHTPGSRNVFTYQPQITPAMREAFLDFVLATAAREHRAGVPVASTMLIHTHHRKPVQLQLGAVVRDHVTQLRQTWRYDRGALESELRDRWETNFRAVTRAIRPDADNSFDDLLPSLDTLFRDPFSVIVLNSGSDDELDYERHRAIKAIVVGGNRLSRGLTLEGLTVSYYLRSADAYDTLMQMGRWFGYREEYIDLTRIYTTSQLYGWFRDLALAESELRLEMARYQRERLTPRDLGMRIRSHPIMAVTARNKMGSGAVIRQSYSARLLQTTYFQVHDRGWLENNTTAVQRLVGQLGQPNGRRDGITYASWCPTWRDVPAATILSFLDEYRTDPRAAQVDASPIRRYIQQQLADGELAHWWISIRGRRHGEDRLGREDRWSSGGLPIHRINRSALRLTQGCIGSLIDPAIRSGASGSADEEVGLSAEQIEAAKRSDEEYGTALRTQRDPAEGLLLIYPISPYSRPKDGTSTDRGPLMVEPRQTDTVAAIALVFPRSSGAATIEYIAGSVEQRRLGGIGAGS